MTQAPPPAPYNVEPLPGPGVYHTITDSEYHAWPLLSNSRMNVLYNESAAHLRWDMDHPESSETPDKLIGDACHKAILEPREYDRVFYRAPKIDKRTKEGKSRWREIEAMAGSRTILVEGDYDTVLKCRDAVFANRRVRRLLENTPEASRELSIVWRDKDTGVMCKARIDIACMHPMFGMIADLKSTQCASKAAFSKSIEKYGYHRQASWYKEGLSYHDTFLPHFCFIAFEKKPPFANAIYRIEEDSVRLGGEQIKRLKRQYADCLESGRWPSYPEHISDIGIPDYKKRQIEMEVATL